MTLREYTEAQLISDIKWAMVVKDEFGNYCIGWIRDTLEWRTMNEETDKEFNKRFLHMDSQLAKIIKHKLTPEDFVKQLDDQLLFILCNAFAEESYAFEKVQEEREYREAELYLGEKVLDIYRYLKYGEK